VFFIIVILILILIVLIALSLLLPRAVVIGRPPRGMVHLAKDFLPAARADAVLKLIVANLFASEPNWCVAKKDSFCQISRIR
jgi:hypothetical protein